MELALFRQRSLESRMAMAQRGELFATLPAGYEKVDRNRIEMTADQRQRDAIHLVFRKFRELGSIRQVFFWFHRNTVELPVRTPGQGLVWRVPTSSRRVAQILTNPIYAGAYAYGRRRQETVIDNGRKRVRRGIAKHNPQDWTVLLRDHHDGYITWDQFERNQELLSENMTKVRGAVRNRPELLTGLLRCGHCDNRIQVRDSGKAIVYRCLGLKDRERANCISFGAVRVDAAVGAALMRALEPVGIEAALAALTAHERKDEAAIRLAHSAHDPRRAPSRARSLPVRRPPSLVPAPTTLGHRFRNATLSHSRNTSRRSRPIRTFATPPKTAPRANMRSTRAGTR